MGQNLGAQEAWRVAVLYSSLESPNQQALRQGIEAEAQRINAQGGRQLDLLTWTAGDGESGVENQVRQFQETLRLKVDLVIVQAGDTAALAGPLQEANRRGIPVVALDQFIRGGTLAAFRTSDHYGAGTGAAEILSAALPPGKLLNLVLVESPQRSSAVDRLDGFLDGLESLGRPYRILKTYRAGDPSTGKTAAQEILKDFPQMGTLDGIFTAHPAAGTALRQALLAAGRRDLPVILAHREAWGPGDRLDPGIGVWAPFTGLLGSETLRTAWDLLQGRRVPFHTAVPVFPWTWETRQAYPGPQGPLPPKFLKPWKSAVPWWTGEIKVVRE